jgi:hypothetical protein
MRNYISMKVEFSRGIVHPYYDVIYIEAIEDKHEITHHHAWKRYEIRILLNTTTQILNKLTKFGGHLIGEGHGKYFGFAEDDYIGKKKAKEFLEGLITARLLQQ